jgi:hypothetical protein
MEIILLLVLFEIKHWYADFVIQTYKQTVHKGIYRDPIGISHTVDHMYTSLIVLIFFSLFIHALAPLTMLAVVIVEGIIHYHVDYIKVHYGCKDHTKPLYWNQFGQDQLAHQLTYLAMVAYLLVP